MIKKENNQYFVYNKEGTKKLSKGYPTEEEAKERLKEIEMFKRSGMKDKSIAFDMQTIYIDEMTGYLTVDAIIARTGVQDYLGFEVGEDNDDIVGVFRSEEEVTNPKSIKTFTNIPITDEHPNELVTIENHNNYAKGSISDVFVVQLNGENALKTKVTVTDKGLISSIKEGKKELSVGYTNILVEREGVYKDKNYKYVQTDIVANHVAVVNAGRCGSVCKLMADQKSNSKEGETMLIKINGKEYDVPDEVAEEFKNLKSEVEGMKEEAETMEGDMNGMKEELETSKDTIDKLQAKVDASASKTTDAKVNSIVSEKMELLSFAKDAKVEGVEPKQTPKQMKAVIVDSLGGKSEGKGETYLDAFIDLKRSEMKDDKDKFEQQMTDAQSHKPQNGGADVSEHENKEI